MNKTFVKLAVAALMITAVFATSCSKKKEQASSKNVTPPGHEKMVEEMKKDLSQSKKIVVARVNGDKITMSDLVREMNLIQPSFVRPGQAPSPQTDEKVKKEALNLLIFRSLALQEARRQGIRAKQEEVDKIMKNLRNRFRSKEAYESYLTLQALNDKSLRKLIADDNVFQTITDKEIFQKVKDFKPDQKRLRQIYDSHKSSFVMPEAYASEDVFFVGGRKDKETMEKAKKILAEIKLKGNHLSKLTHDSSFVIRKLMVTENFFPKIFSSLRDLKPGDVSGIIQGRDGLHIIKVKAKLPARPMTFKEARHIIVQQLRNEAVEKRKEEWESQLRKKAKIEISLKESDKINRVN